MKKLSLLVFALAALSFAPAALAQCADCIVDQCDWGEYMWAECWYDWCPPCGCFTTGRCFSAAPSERTDLALEYRIASVEIHQGGVLVARKTEDAVTTVADRKPVPAPIRR